ncbi:hypothetical protein [Marinobacterium sediminicola]|uniref:Preprotein translocase subunit YajC n=1 Tax=Marinobacterium sediminicola TaxID=518898 RepID=A0ABY1RVN5_9GAMM|nr:hypothetical protein [Marinobacterium sediminicola]ULG70601.1 hypothetical protein LN244_07255 [Marinobacterium sediminicola]SMR68902.1 hypothetical protein SAMN04487964_10147 [Marinobacterium sediminicola]
MKWLIIGFILASLIGSVMWVMPSPRQRYQAQLRMRARQMGIQVQLARITLPRAKGEVEQETVSVPAYRFIRDNLERVERDNWPSWEVHRLETIDNEGLPAGWSWLKGQGRLSSEAKVQLVALLEALPEDVVGVESTPLHLSLYWHEKGEADRIDQLQSLVKPLLANKI